MSENDSKKVMLIDDDTLLLDMYGIKFEKSGFEVVRCQSADVCISKLEEGYSPDILMFDLTMPVVDGATLIKIIRDKKYATKAKMFAFSNTGHESNMDDIVKKLGIDGYILKANNKPSDVVEKIKKELGVK